MGATEAEARQKQAKRTLTIKGQHRRRTHRTQTDAKREYTAVSRGAFGLASPYHRQAVLLTSGMRATGDREGSGERTAASPSSKLEEGLTLPHPPTEVEPSRRVKLPRKQQRPTRASTDGPLVHGVHPGFEDPDSKTSGRTRRGHRVRTRTGEQATEEQERGRARRRGTRHTAASAATSVQR